MKHLLAALLLLFAFAAPALAAPEPAASAAVSTVNGVKLDLINKLEADKYLTAVQAAEVKGKYIGSDSEIAEADGTSWTRWLSWVNVLKVLAILALLIAFNGLIIKFVKFAWATITMVPTYVYQGVFLACTLWLTVAPATIWASQAFYLALFGAFGNALIVAWVLDTYPKVAEAIKKMFSLGIPPYVLASFYGALYFAVLAIAYSSQIFGFFAAVCVSSMFGFGMFYMPGVLFLDIRRNAVGALLISHTLILIAYVAAKHAAVPYLPLFAAGFEYYCPIGLGLAMLVGVSPWHRHGFGFNFLVALAIFGLAMFGYSFYSEHGIGAIIGIFAALLLIEWVMYASWCGGLIIGTAMTGAILYGIAMVLESNGRAIMTAIGL